MYVYLQMWMLMWIKVVGVVPTVVVVDEDVRSGLVQNLIEKRTVLV